MAPLKTSASKGRKATTASLFGDDDGEDGASFLVKSAPKIDGAGKKGQKASLFGDDEDEDGLFSTTAKKGDTGIGSAGKGVKGGLFDEEGDSDILSSLKPLDTTDAQAQAAGKKKQKKKK
jgi:hypothetical protein